MKSIILTAEAHMAAAECECIEFERGVPQLVDDARAEVILRNEMFAEVPAEVAPEKPADKPAPVPFVAPTIARVADADEAAK